MGSEPTKTWGPFTGRQLTTMFVAVLIAAVLLPSTVWAVDTFSNVAIEDPSSGVKAKVDSTHSLQVSDGSGPLTVDGTVTARPTSLKNLFAATTGYSGGGCQVMATAPTGKALIVTDLGVNIYAGPAPAPTQFIAVYPNKTCAGSPAWDETPTGLGSTQVSFHDGFAVAAGQGVSAVDFESSGYAFEVYVHGYTVSATSVAASAASASSGHAHAATPAG